MTTQYVKFVQDNEACVEGPLYAGLVFYAGYPTHVSQGDVNVDSAADSLVQEPLQGSGPSVDEIASRNEFEEQEKNENLKAIVHDDTKWSFFVQSVSLRSPQSEDVKSTRMQLMKGFERGDWSQVKNDPLFDELTQKQTPESRSARDLNGEGKRMNLWLENSDFFKQLFTAVQDGDLFSRPHLITDNRLIDFVLSLPDDAE
jgi:hypothetical protein